VGTVHRLQNLMTYHALDRFPRRSTGAVLRLIHTASEAMALKGVDVVRALGVSPRRGPRLIEDAKRNRNGAGAFPLHS
jgi:hypothetical protein